MILFASRGAHRGTRRVVCNPACLLYTSSWGRKSFAREACNGRFITLASGIEGDEDALPIRSDARVLAVALKAGEAATYRFARGRRRGYLVASKGRLTINDVEIGLGDGAAIEDETDVRITALDDAELLLADTHA